MLNYNKISLIFGRVLGLENRLEGLCLKAGSALRKLLQGQEILVAFLVGMEGGKTHEGGEVVQIEIWDLLHSSHGIEEKGKSYNIF